ncbi:MAG: EAL domain-containing protein [Xenococcaceae cyanobacterium MO_188.B32]|nr:EAL domain-containing protein [Xenococcaceae cyanobacterium MO_188.B32]
MIESVNSLSNKTILIVDDTPNNLQLLFEYLTNAGYKILVAQSGKKAIKTALSVHPELILLDVMMSEIDGFATCSQLKNNANTKDIPIIFMTALTETANKLQGFMLGAVDYITKPIEQEELLARIKTHLSLQSLRKRLARDAAQQKLLFEISDRIRKSLNLNLILQTATKEISSLLNCDLVWVARLGDKSISIEAISTATNIDIKLPKTLPQDYLCSNLEEYQFYLHGNTKTIDLKEIENREKQHLQEVEQQKNCCLKFPQQFIDSLKLESLETEILSQATSLFNPQARLIVPILINKSQSTDSHTTNNTLWGWLIADQCNSIRQWQAEEIDLLQRLTTQLAIGIKQGLLYKQLSQLALVDSLTNVFNRGYFDRQLNLEWLRLQRIASPLSLIICDVDCFKIYNDTYGHQQGDKCLQQVAKAISTVVKRSSDVVARYGGEEFVVILPHTPPSGAIKVAEDIRVAVKKLNIPHRNSSVDSVVTISVGVASTIPNLEDNSGLLMKAADLALYKAKERGRDCISVYQYPISHSKSRQDLEIYWIKRIRQALKENLFSLYAQPITSLQRDDQKKHFEILLRLTDKGDRVISPHLFLDIAERNCLMPDIDAWVINNLLNKLAASGDYSYWQNYRFSINLSGASLNSESFLEFLSQKLSDYHFLSNLLCFEITENIAVSNLDKVAKFINSLKNLGCSFALDDFGKGMSSLTYLNNLPVDYLKIDGSFIKELNSNKASKVMVEAINHIAEGIGLKTVAEFVENQTILETVKDLKVDYAQGFHLGRPEALMDVITPLVTS